MKLESNLETKHESKHESKSGALEAAALGAVSQAPVRKVATTVYITEEQQARLKELNRRTRVPVAEYIREGIDLVLEKNRDELPGQLSFDSTKLK